VGQGGGVGAGGRAVAREGQGPAAKEAAMERQKAGGHAGGKGSGKLPEPSKGDTEAAGPSDKLHIWFGYQSILAGPKGVDIQGRTRNFCPSLSIRSFVQNGRQGFLTWPGAVFAYRLGLSFGAPLSGVVGLVSLSFIALKSPESEARVC